MEANSSNTNPFRALPACRGRIGAKKRHSLLAEFLRKKHVNANIPEEETSSSLELIELPKDATTILELDDKLLFKILVLLPSESLLKLQFVCKKWFGLINSSVFIALNTRSYSETVLISQKLTLLKPHSSPDLPLQLEENKAKSYFHLLNLDCGNNNTFIESSVDNLVEILATYEGFILATKVDSNNQKSLILMNPVTRKHVPIPLGTFVSNAHDESYGIAFCDETNSYKLVHFYCDRSGGVHGSEILNISTRKWTEIEGPHDPGLLGSVKWRFLVSIGGSLYWIPRRRGCDYFVSMNVTNEEFCTKNLPVCCGLMDRLVDIGGFLGFVAREEVGFLQVWILKNMNDNWVKKYSINVNIAEVGYPIPICSLRSGDGMVFESAKHRLYVYSFDDGEMKLMVHSGEDDDDGDGVWFRKVHKNYIPHRNTLASWEDHHDRFSCSAYNA